LGQKKGGLEQQIATEGRSSAAHRKKREKSDSGPTRIVERIGRCLRKEGEFFYRSGRREGTLRFGATLGKKNGFLIFSERLPPRKKERGRRRSYPSASGKKKKHLSYIARPEKKKKNIFSLSLHREVKKPRKEKKKRMIKRDRYLQEKKGVLRHMGTEKEESASPM